MANYLIMPYAKNNQDPTPGSQMLGLSVGPTLLFTLDLGSVCLSTTKGCQTFRPPSGQGVGRRLEFKTKEVLKDLSARSLGAV
ncbi:hypothetical protein PoB_002649600 [Plakobranchus ocellatus]|uniref:Uncharacterized protein n=1 Tax=Plakobranchus ocellatus TaxID=259542 RepID=A0AAV3ZVL9_9GAST|nr:hypothetical protein PoB_002649600 [Plakobranchus ocellatus]